MTFRHHYNQNNAGWWSTLGCLGVALSLTLSFLVTCVLDYRRATLLVILKAFLICLVSIIHWLFHCDYTFGGCCWQGCHEFVLLPYIMAWKKKKRKTISNIKFQWKKLKIGWLVTKVAPHLPHRYASCHTYACLFGSDEKCSTSSVILTCRK